LVPVRGPVGQASPESRRGPVKQIGRKLKIVAKPSASSGRAASGRIAGASGRAAAADKLVAPASVKISAKHLRQVGLATMLMQHGLRGVDRDSLMQLDGYHPDDHNERADGYSLEEGKTKFDRMFQRDIQELAQIGLKVVEYVSDPQFDGPGGRKRYRIAAESLVTDLIDLEPEEALLLDTLAAEFGSAMLDSAMATALASAVVRLKAGVTGMGIAEDVRKTAIKRALAPRVAEEERLAALQKAHRLRVPVVFQYRGLKDHRPTQRTMEPWAIVRRGRHTHVIGRDRSVMDGDPVRNFRLSRIKGDVRVLEEEAEAAATQVVAKPKAKPGRGGRSGPTKRVSPHAGTFEIPSDFDVETYFSPDPLTPARDNRLEGVTIDFDADVGFIVANQFAHRHMLAENKDGSVTLHIRSAAPGELWEFLSEYAGHFTVREAKGVTEALRERIETTLAVYSTATGREGR